MVLDNEKQRGTLMQIINAVPISGTYQQIRGTITSFDDLIVAVTNAQIAPPKGVAPIDIATLGESEKANVEEPTTN